MDPHKAASPFSTGPKGKTKFATAYAAGRIPVRISHFGTGRNRIQWDEPVGRVDYRELLPLAAEGIRETVHPHVFVAPMMFKEMCSAAGSRTKILPCLATLIRPLRLALMDAASFKPALEAITTLSRAVGPALDAYLPELVVQVAKKAFDARLKDAVTTLLQTLEENGGPEALPAIKKKVPTYTSVRF